MNFLRRLNFKKPLLSLGGALSNDTTIIRLLHDAQFDESYLCFLRSLLKYKLIKTQYKF